MKTGIFSKESFSRSLMFLVEIFVEQVKPEAIEQCEFQRTYILKKTEVLLPLDNRDFEAKIKMDNNSSSSSYTNVKLSLGSFIE